MLIQFHYYRVYLLQQNTEILTTITIATSLIILFAVVMIISIIRYQNKQKQYDERERVLENEFLKASFEAREHALEELSERLHGDLQNTLALAIQNLIKALQYAENTTSSEFILQAKELVANAIAETQSLSKDLDPKYITGHSLEENIEKQLQRVQESISLKTIFIKSEKEIQLNNEHQIFMYRIMQEAINNCVKYAEATLLKVQMESYENHFIIRIEDDGNGCDIKKILKTKKGLGIISMQHRTELMKGKFTIGSSLKFGTKISINIPYDRS